MLPTGGVSFAIGARVYLAASKSSGVLMKTRTLELDHTRANAAERTVPCTVSTDTPCDMGNMVEVLDHTPGAVDLSRMPLPVIEAHNLRGSPLGVFEGAELVGGLSDVNNLGR